MTLSEWFKQGDQRALGQAISLVEGGSAEGHALLSAVYERSGNARVYGITGPPGAGKSTLVQEIAVIFRRQGHNVAIVAVDPSSPFTGGAVLGDRVRMGTALADEGVFMRSLADRGHLGGLSEATGDVITLLDAFGFDSILVETVGTGQSEVEIMQVAQTTLVVFATGLGDDVQAMKAGILEIADVYAVNKADRDGADQTVADLAAMLDLIHMGNPGINHWPISNSVNATQRQHKQRPALGVHLVRRFGSAVAGDLSWFPPIVKTIATTGTGVKAIVERLIEHDDFLRQAGRWQHQHMQRTEARLCQLVGALAARAIIAEAKASGDLDRALSRIVARTLDPHAAAQALLARRFGKD